MTQKELALVLFNRLIDLEVEQVAMAGVLDSRLQPDSQIQPWRPKVRTLRESKTLRDTARAKYEHIEQSLLASTDECPGALSLLVSVARGLV